MELNLLFGVSLTAAFLAGMLALFAPCCITFLFPAYLGTIFKEGKKVMFYTLIFALGLASVLVPVALGFRFFISFFDSYHTLIYYIGGLFLIFMGINTVKPLFYIPPFLKTRPEIGKKVNVGSVFGLGIVSGVSSSCCAPVLFAAIALTTLSPSFIQALVVSMSYVLGIVFPLFIMSLFYKKLVDRVSGENRKKIHDTLSFAGAAIFILSGLLIITFNYMNKLTMYQVEGYSIYLRNVVFELSRYFQNPVIDILVFLIILFVFYKLIKKYGSSKE